MRLVCPSCDAEYEIARSAIPRTGRAVECSNCGHSWFQAFADLTIAETTQGAGPGAGMDVTDTDAPPRALDESVLEVLRQEAAREVTARQAEARHSGSEMQTEMPLAPRAAGADHFLALKDDGDISAPPDAPPSDAPRPRRDLLPAIDDVSAALDENRDTSAAPQAAPQAPKIKPTPLERGGLLLALLGVILLALYVFAPEIAAKVPALSQACADYVATVDRAMRWIQDHVAQMGEALQALARR